MEHSKVVVHCKPNIPWHARYVELLRAGLARHEVELGVTSSLSISHGETPVILGPNYWRETQNECYAKRIDYLTVNRAFWGDPNSVAIGWNGFNGYADFVTDKNDRATRIPPWEPISGVERTEKVTVFGQVHLHSLRGGNLMAWYFEACPEGHFYRPHPAVLDSMPNRERVDPSTPLKVSRRTSNVGRFLGSTAVVDAVLAGMYVEADDPSSVACGWNLTTDARRYAWLHHLARCQYTVEEIRDGVFWDILTRRNPQSKHSAALPQ